MNKKNKLNDSQLDDIVGGKILAITKKQNKKQINKNTSNTGITNNSSVTSNKQNNSVTSLFDDNPTNI